jgi:hypothetical protein
LGSRFILEVSDPDVLAVEFLIFTNAVLIAPDKEPEFAGIAPQGNRQVFGETIFLENGFQAFLSIPFSAVLALIEFGPKLTEPFFKGPDSFFPALAINRKLDGTFDNKSAGRHFFLFSMEI